ncbi:MAG TPA: hypothetical protein DCY89_02150 [Gammaproteobacteria bacterium]|nr:hypothetical protein [Gammaproteobacteria bacterium]
MEPLYRQRLIGAMVLVALAVVVVPLLLGEPRPLYDSQATHAVAPAPPRFEGQPSPEQQAVTDMHAPSAFPEADLAPPAPSADSLDAWLNPSAVSAETPDEGTVAAAAPTVPAVPAAPREAAPPTAATESDPESGGVWVVQVGSYTDVDNARRRVEQLQARAFEAWVAEPEQPGGPFRVWVGPELERTRAVALQQRIQREFGVETQVRRHVSR